MADTQYPTNDYLNANGIPDPATFRVHRAVRPLQGGGTGYGLAVGATLPASTATTTDVYPIAGALQVRYRLKYTCAGTLRFRYRRPPPFASEVYTAETPHADVAVVADTEAAVDITPAGEAWLEVRFTATAAGGVVSVSDLSQQ